ncbi:hypothetical protein D7X75_19955 [Corallococcus sp. CA031C]|nr:hypothetical protein D7X75_19955 [Corallococcus sp. CA031C]
MHLGLQVGLEKGPLLQRIPHRTYPTAHALRHSSTLAAVTSGTLGADGEDSSPGSMGPQPADIHSSPSPASHCIRFDMVMPPVLCGPLLSAGPEPHGCGYVIC